MLAEGTVHSTCQALPLWTPLPPDPIKGPGHLVRGEVVPGGRQRLVVEDEPRAGRKPGLSLLKENFNPRNPQFQKVCQPMRQSEQPRSKVDSPVWIRHSHPLETHSTSHKGLHLLQSPGKKSCSDRFPVKPTGEKIKKTNGRLPIAQANSNVSIVKLRSRDCQFLGTALAPQVVCALDVPLQNAHQTSA